MIILSDVVVYLVNWRGEQVKFSLSNRSIFSRTLFCQLSKFTHSFKKIVLASLAAKPNNQSANICHIMLSKQHSWIWLFKLFKPSSEQTIVKKPVKAILYFKRCLNSLHIHLSLTAALFASCESIEWWSLTLILWLLKQPRSLSSPSSVRLSCGTWLTANRSTVAGVHAGSPKII